MVLCFREGGKQTSKRNTRKKRGVDNCWSRDLKWEIGNAMPARCMENSFTEPGQEFDPGNTNTVGRWIKVKVKVTQLCLTLCDSMDYSPWNSPGQNTGMGSGSLLQGIFPIQGLNPGLLHCRQILYQLSHKGGWIQWLKTIEPPCLDFLSEVLFI